MATTTNRQLPYPLPGSDPDVPYWMQQLAEKTDLDLKGIRDSLDFFNQKEHAEYTTGIVTSNTDAGVNFGIATVDSSKTWNNDFVAPNDSSGTTVAGIKFKREGLYIVNVTGNRNSGTFSQSHLWGLRGSETLLSQNHQGYGSGTAIGNTVCWFAAGDVLQVGWTTNATCTVSSRIKVSRLT